MSGGRTLRWLRVWVAVLGVFTLVTAGFLLVITNSLAAINGNLAAVDRAVTGTGANTRSLPGHVDALNTSLAALEPALQPLVLQSSAIVALLRSIDQSVASAQSSLRGASSSLGGALGRFNGIRDLLIDMNDPPDGLGIQNAHRRVALVNGVDPSDPPAGSQPAQAGARPQALTGVVADTSNILAGLVSLNAHLRSVCRSPSVHLLTGAGSC